MFCKYEKDPKAPAGAALYKKMNKKIDRFVCEIKSHSHILKESAFAFLKSGESLIRVIEVKNNAFKIEVQTSENMRGTKDKNIEYAFFVTTSFLMALNIASLGHFSWSIGSRLFWFFDYCNDSGLKEKVFIHHNAIQYPADKKEFTEIDAKNSIIILGSILLEKDQGFRREYLKGITHMNAGFGDLIYHRESFANFYRSLEYFVTTKVLKKKRLKNELKELQKGIKRIGLDNEFIDEFKVLYRIRSEQVMHAQKKQKEVDTDDVFKIKTFTDYAFHKYYKKIGHDLLDRQRSGTTNQYTVQ
jgi:hypothetical protein